MLNEEVKEENCKMCGKEHKFLECSLVKLFIENCRKSDFGWLSRNENIFKLNQEKEKWK